MQETKTFKKDDIILSAGTQASEAYLILSGSVVVYLENNEKIVDLATLGPNQIFGEKALIEGGEITAHVKAVEDTELQIITQEHFKTVLDDADPIIQALLPMLLNRVTETNKKLLESETREFIDIEFL